MSSDSIHFAACNYPALGHTRPMLGLVARLVRTHPNLILTLFVYTPYVPSTTKHLNGLIPDDDSVLKRVRLVGVGPPLSDDGIGFQSLFAAYATLSEYIPEPYKQIIHGRSVTCSATGTIFDYANIPTPTVVLSDTCTPFAAQAIKAITPEVKIVVSWMATASFFIYRFGPNAVGGFGSLEQRAIEAMTTERFKGKSLMEVAAALETEPHGKPLANAEGLEVYDYEMFPQDLDNSPFTPVWINSAKQVNGWADGVAICSTGHFESEARDALRQWYQGQEHKGVFYVGPCTAPPSESKLLEDGATGIKTFLDSHQPKSVWLISFGTLFYPATHPNQIETLLKTLLKTSTPFLMSRAASMYTPLPDNLIKEAGERNLGLVVDFIPQEAVLAHPSTGIFVTHGGVNSMFESLVAGVMNVFWPMTADQPMHAAHMTLKLDCAFELVQVRTGTGARPLKRGGIVEGTDDAIAHEVEQIVNDLKGPVGDRKRRNLAAVRAQLLEDLSPGGDADIEVKKLVDFGTQKN